MHDIFATKTVSVTELKRSYLTVIRQAEEEATAIAVLNNNKPEAYLVPAEAYQHLLERLEDLEDAILVMTRQNEPTVEVSLDELDKL